MTCYQNDIQRVERIIFPAIFIDVLINGVVDKETQAYKDAYTLLTMTVIECISDLSSKSQSKIIRRAERIHMEIMTGFRNEEAACDKVALVAFYALQAITDCDYLVLPEVSFMSKAMDLILPALLDTAEIEKINRSAKKQARKMLAKLQSSGYFVGVPLEPQMNEAA